jgi:hypothetical protein
MEQEHGASRRRLPGYDDDWTAPGETTRTAQWSRDDGVRRVRRMSNWTAAALIAAAAATSGYFAHATTAAAPGASSSGTVSHGQPGASVTGHKPILTHPVVTSGGSGVTAGSSGSGGAGGSGAVVAGWRDN